jgi:hypothetical protein
MKSLYKRIVSISLAGMIVAGGFSLARVNAHANSNNYYNFSQSYDVQDSDIALISISDPRNQSKYGFELISVGLKYEKYDMSFNSSYDFYKFLNRRMRRLYFDGAMKKYCKIEINEEYVCKINGLIFKFKVLR